MSVVGGYRSLGSPITGFKGYENALMAPGLFPEILTQASPPGTEQPAPFGLWPSSGVNPYSAVGGPAPQAYAPQGTAQNPAQLPTAYAPGGLLNSVPASQNVQLSGLSNDDAFAALFNSIQNTSPDVNSYTNASAEQSQYGNLAALPTAGGYGLDLGGLGGGAYGLPGGIGGIGAYSGGSSSGNSYGTGFATSGQAQKIGNLPGVLDAFNDMRQFDTAFPFVQDTVGSVTDALLNGQLTGQPIDVSRSGVNAPNVMPPNPDLTIRAPITRPEDAFRPDFNVPDSSTRSDITDIMGQVGFDPSMFDVTRPDMGIAPEITIGGVWDPTQVQAQINTARAQSAQQTASDILQMQEGLAAQGFGVNSPLGATLAAQLGAMGYGNELAAATDIGTQAAEMNAAQRLASQQAAEAQFATRNAEDLGWAGLMANQGLQGANNLLGWGQLAESNEANKMNELLGIGQLAADEMAGRQGENLAWGQLLEQGGSNRIGEELAQAQLMADLWGQGQGFNLDWAALAEQNNQARTSEQLAAAQLAQQGVLGQQANLISSLNPLYSLMQGLVA